MGFFPSHAEPDIWMRDKGDHYEYIAVHVDDLLIASRNAAEIIRELTEDLKFKLKVSYGRYAPAERSGTQGRRRLNEYIIG